MQAKGPRPLVAGNWKMNGLRDSVSVLGELRRAYTPELRAAADLLVCPPATLILPFVVEAAGSGLLIGGQNVHAEASGAYTGDVSAEMLADLGATCVIVGHSERRALCHEDDAAVRAKAAAAHRAGLTAIICVGETRRERDEGRALAVVAAQLRGSVPQGASSANTVLAYEPVWAIGTGLTPTPHDVAEMHASIRATLRDLVGEGEGARLRILYGGSVKPANARDLLGIDHVDGALVGGASLVAKDFLGIAGAYLAEMASS